MNKNLLPLYSYVEKLKEENLLLESNISVIESEKLVGHISYDSQDMHLNTLFVCKGIHFKEEYLKQAARQGAFVYLSEKTYDMDLPYILVSDIRKAMALLANMYYHQIWKKIHLIGITGTKGKSSTAYFMKYILDEYEKGISGKETSILSGIDNYDGNKREESHLTTPEAFVFHKHIFESVKNRITYMTMEVSSQALKYHRTKDVIFDVGCFLNLGIDHISDVEHSSFLDYKEAKKILFKQSTINVINIDDPYAEEFYDVAKESKVMKKIITFGTKEGADIYGYDLQLERRGITFKVKCDSFDETFKIGLTGVFNVSNALAAIAMSYGLNIPLEYIKAGLKKAKVSGRMEIFTDKEEEMTVLVDYAHNQMSFQSLFKSIEAEYPGKQVTIVFGCPGKKALGRRKELGDIAGKHADFSIITEEDAGEESVMKISKEIAEHIKSQGGAYKIIPDREEAIAYAISNSRKDGVILVTGKGRETRQKRGLKYIDTLSDVQLVEKYLKEKDKDNEKS